MVIENSRKMRPISPLMNTSGMNTAASESVMARMVKLISLADSTDASNALRPVFHQAHRVFQKHDGVIHQEPDGQRQSHQRQVVEAVAQNVHRNEREQQRQRQRDGRNQRVGGPSQEDEDHHHHQHECDVERRLHIFDAAHDGLRAVVGWHEQNGTGKLRLNGGQQVAHRPSRPRPHSRPRDGNTDHDRCAGLRVAAHPEAHVDAFVLQRRLSLATSFR